MSLDDAADFDDRVENAGGRFAMNESDVRDGFVRRECTIQSVGVSGRVLRRADHDVSYRQMLQYQHDPFAISPVGQDRDLAVGRHARGEHGFDTERAAPLHEDRFPAGFDREPRDFENFSPNPVDLRIELVMPGAGVVEHRLFDREAGGQRTRREQEFIARGRNAAQRLCALWICSCRRIDVHLCHLTLRSERSQTPVRPSKTCAFSYSAKNLD